MKHAQLSMFEQHHVGASTMAFGGKTSAPGQAEFQLYEEVVLIIRTNVEKVIFGYNENVGTIREHKLTQPSEVICIPPQLADRYLDDAREMQTRNIEDAMNLRRLIDGSEAEAKDKD